MRLTIVTRKLARHFGDLYQIVSVEYGTLAISLELKCILMAMAKAK